MTTTTERILLIDDDPAVLLSVGDQLHMEGYEVITASTGEQALKVLQAVTPNLIILDISMPGMTGLAFLKKISAADGVPRYPVLVFTARANMENFFTKTPVEGFLTKTSDPSSLTNEVKRILLKYKKASRAESESHHRPHLMIIEDEPRLSARLQSFFTSAGYETTILHDCATLIETLQTKTPDIILLKEVLPNFSGSSIASGLSPFTTSSGISVILYDTSGLHRSDSKFPNVDRFVTSNTPPDLLKAVTAVLSTRA
jgi:DNA-binding response OmpR family regulator